MQQDKLKKTLKLAWSKGLSLFMAMAGAILLVFLLFRFDSILDQILRVCQYTYAYNNGNCYSISA